MKPLPTEGRLGLRQRGAQEPLVAQPRLTSVATDLVGVDGEDLLDGEEYRGHLARRSSVRR
jgi:hypothetical protein